MHTVAFHKIWLVISVVTSKFQIFSNYMGPFFAVFSEDMNNYAEKTGNTEWKRERMTVSYTENEMTAYFYQ